MMREYFVSVKRAKSKWSECTPYPDTSIFQETDPPAPLQVLGKRGKVWGTYLNLTTLKRGGTHVICKLLVQIKVLSSYLLRCWKLVKRIFQRQYLPILCDSKRVGRGCSPAHPSLDLSPFSVPRSAGS